MISIPTFSGLFHDILSGFIPETLLIITILVLCILSFSFKSAERKAAVIYTVVTGLVLALFATFFLFLKFEDSVVLFSGMLISDTLSILFRSLILVTTLITAVYSFSYLDKTYKFQTEYFILLLSSALGAMLMCSSSDLIMVFVSMETLGISSYLLTGYIKTDKANNEASLKYLVIGSAATALFLYGSSYLYGLTGSTLFSEISYKVTSMGYNVPLLVLMIFIIGALAYKTSLAPFHTWTPDVYQGAPTSYSAYLSVGSKLAGFALLIRLIIVIFGCFSSWQILFIILSVLSMIIGNLTALIQVDIKRLLAYSSIAQAGYVVIGLAVANVYSLSSMIYYLVVYMFMQLGAWCAVLLFFSETNSNKIKDYSGLLSKRPLLAVSFTICLLSLAGIPITSGFFAKFFLFQSAVLGGEIYVWLVVIALINSAVSLYYYLRVVKLMLVDKPSTVVEAMSIESYEMIPQAKGLNLILGLMLSGVLLLGIFATSVLNISRDSVDQLLNYKANIVNLQVF